MVFLLATAAACNDGSDSSSVVSAPSARGRLVLVHADVALDPRTNLEWARRDHEQSLSWDEADRHCRGLALGERGSWRLPEIDELQALYDPHLAMPCGDRTCRFDAAIRLGGPYVWSASTRGPGTRFYFDASYGTSFSPGVDPRLVRRVLCVRRVGPAHPTPAAP